MRNYAEELAYWYFRLNGFFILENYVLEKKNDEFGNTYETDIIAVRFPYVYEDVGGYKDDWHDKLKELIPNFDKNILGVICEVKSGEGNYHTRKLFRKEKLEKCLSRLGFFEYKSEEFSVALNELEKGSVYSNEMYTIVKILISLQNNNCKQDVKNISLFEVDNFICSKIKKYEEKYSDRGFFMSNLIQYLTWVKHNKP